MASGPSSWFSATGLQGLAGGLLPQRRGDTERQTRDENHTSARPSPPHNFTRDNSSTSRQITLDNIQYLDLPSRFWDQILCIIYLQGCTVFPCHHSACLTDIKQPQPRHQVALNHHRHYHHIASSFHQLANNQTIKIKPFIWPAVPETVPSEHNILPHETCPTKNRLSVKRPLDEPNFGQPSQLPSCKLNSSLIASTLSCTTLPTCCWGG